MNVSEPPRDPRLNEALALLISDARQACERAADLLADPLAAAVSRAEAHAVLALVALREGEVIDGEREIAAADALLAGTPPALRTGQLLDHTRAQVHRREGRLPEAEALLQPLHALADERPAVDAYLTAGSLGIVRSMRGDDDAALQLFYEALSLARRSGADSLLVNALNNLGSFQSDLCNWDDALPMLRECLEGAQRLGSRRQVIYAAGNLVQCLCLMGQAADALAVAREHLIACIRSDDPPALQRDEEIAQALLDNGLVDAAAAALGEELHVDTMSNETGTARAVLWARVLLHRGQADAALRICQARQRDLDADTEPSTGAIDQVDLLRVTARCAAAVGDHALSYERMERAWALHERLLGRAARARRIGLQVVHQLAEAERERDRAREMAAALGSLNDSLRSQVAENERLQAQLRAQALEDPLTGAYNRRFLQDAGAALHALALRRGEALAAVVVDLDQFKRVNDRHGHAAGDRVLQGFARLARSALRASDVVCRSGGEEFVLLLYGAAAEAAGARVERLLQEFRTLAFEGNAGAFGASFSAGVAAARSGETLERLLHRADTALYEAKAAGRDRVAIASEKSIAG